MIFAALSISLNGSVPLVVALLLVLCALAFLFYRYTLPPLPPVRRYTLSILRSLALMLLLLIFFEPVFRRIQTDEQEPVVAVLVDDSQSMTITDARGDRSAQMRSLLTNIISGDLPAGTTIQYIPFSSALEIGRSTDSITFSGEVTNLSGAMSGLRELKLKENLQAVVLLSDGNYTAGKNPLYEAEALHLPVFTVGVGDTVDQKDILIDHVATNSIAYAGTRVPVEVSMRSSGFGGESVEVTLNDGATVVDHTTITLGEGTRNYTISMNVMPAEQGTKKYTAKVSLLSGELTEKNNTHSFFMKVLKSKLSVVMFAGAPSADVAALRQAIADDGHFSLRSFVQRNTGEFYEGSVSRTTLDSADCLVMIGFPSNATTGATLEQLDAVITQGRKPLFFINGKSTDYTKLQALTSVLPFGWTGVNPGEMLLGASIPEQARHHELIDLEGVVTADGWQELPPVFKALTQFRAKPEAEVLAHGVLRNIVLAEPLVLTRNILRQKTLAVTGYGIWRWQLMAQENVKTKKFLPLFVSNTIRWLTTNEADKRVRVTPVQETFTTAERVAFTGQVYDDQLRPVENAELIVTLERGGDKFHLAMNTLGSGMYEGSIDGLGEGDYTFSANATVDGVQRGEDNGRFSVGQVNVEFLQTQMNKPLLEQLAFRTGGEYYDGGNTEKLRDDLVARARLTPNELIRTSQIELWNWKYLAMLIIALFALEWFLRKRSGML